MSKTVQVTSLTQFEGILRSSQIVVTDFWAEWCGPCKVIAPVYQQLSASLSRPGKVTFTSVDVDNVKDVAQKYSITAMPTFMVFENGTQSDRVVGANPQKLSELVRRIAQKADATSSSGGASVGDASSSSGSGANWLGAALPRGYDNATDQVDIRGIDLMNADSEVGGVRVLFDGSKPSSLKAAVAGKGKGKSDDGADGANKDWVESDTDEQLMLYIPFQSMLKVHTLQLTSLPPFADDADEAPMRPRTVRLYTNRSTNLGFDEAESSVPTQEFVIEKEDWDAATGTARLDLRFVKFQNVVSLVIFVVDGDGDGDKTRLDRVRIIGEIGEKRDKGKLEKVGDDR